MAVCVTMYTCNRPEYAKKTLTAIIKNLMTKQPLYLHIADDGSDDPEAALDLRSLAISGRRRPFAGVSITNSGRRGYGASYNVATQVTHNLAGFHLALEDDWELTRPLDLDPLIAILEDASHDIQCIRLGYLGWTQRLSGFLVKSAGQQVLRLSAASEEPHVFAGHPRLETTGRQVAVGPWPEGIPAGLTEFQVAERPAARSGVAWPLDLVKTYGDLFAHIGTIRSEEAQA